MARLSYVEPASASPEAKNVLDMLRGQVGNVHKMLAHRPEVLKNFLAFYSSVGKSLERRLYELVYIRVSMLNQCHY